MAESISIGNNLSQTELFPTEIARRIKEFLQCDMGKTTKPKSSELHLGPWLALFGVSETQAAEAGGCGQPYIANMIAGRKRNPSALILLRISDLLGITVNDFYQKAPALQEMAPMANLSAKARETILALQRRKA